MSEGEPIYEGNMGGTGDLVKNVIVDALSEWLDNSDLIPRGKNREYTEAVEHVIRGLSIESQSSKDDVLLNAFNRIKQLDADNYCTSLILAVVAGRIEAISSVLELRDKYHADLSKLLEEANIELREAVAIDDKEEIDAIRDNISYMQRELGILRSGPFNRIIDLLLDVELLNEVPRRPLTESENSHALLELSKGCGNCKFSAQFGLRLKLSKLYGVPPAELFKLETKVASAKPIEDRKLLLKFVNECRKNGNHLSTEDKGVISRFVSKYF